MTVGSVAARLLCGGGRKATCGPSGGALWARPRDAIRPRIAASRKQCGRFSTGVAGAYKGGRRIDNPPQVKNLPHKM